MVYLSAVTNPSSNHAATLVENVLPPLHYVATQCFV